MAEIQDIINEIKNGTSATPADTTTTDTTQATNTTTEVIETPEVVIEGTEIESNLTEVTDEVVTTTTDTPVVTENVAETKVESNYDLLLKKLGVQSEDEISARFTELQTIKETKTLGKLIDTLAEKGIDPLTALTFHKLDVAALSPKEKIAWDIKMQHPTIDDDKISAMIDEEYGDETNLAQQGKLEIKAEEAGKRLLEQKVKILDPTVANKEIEEKNLVTQQAEAKRVEEWKVTPKVKEVLSNLNKIEQKVSFSTFGEDKPVNKSFNFSYAIPKDGLAEVENALRNVGIAQGLDANNPESVATLKAMAENLYWIQNKDKVLASLANTVASHLHKEAATKFHNSNPNKGGGVFLDTGKQSIADKRLEATINALGR